MFRVISSKQKLKRKEIMWVSGSEACQAKEQHVEVECG